MKKLSAETLRATSKSGSSALARSWWRSRSSWDSSGRYPKAAAPCPETCGLIMICTVALSPGTVTGTVKDVADDVVKTAFNHSRNPNT